MLIGSPGQNNGHGSAFLYKKNNQKWELNRVFENPIQTINEGFPHRFGYSVAISDNYLSISSPFYNDGLVYVYSLENLNSRITTEPLHRIDVRNLGDVEGCYAEGPNKFGFGISTSFNNDKLLIGSLKDFVHLIEYKDGIPFSIDIPNPSQNNDQNAEKIKFGESVYVGDRNIYVSALNADNGKGKVFVYPFLNSSRTDENPWTNPYIIQPSSTLDNSHFGYKISENDNQVSISTFNQRLIYNYVINLNIFFFFSFPFSFYFFLSSCLFLSLFNFNYYYFLAMALISTLLAALISTQLGSDECRMEERQRQRARPHIRHSPP